MSNEYEKPYAEGESKLVDAVIEVIKEQVCSSECGADWTAIDELLRFVPRHNLINYLPEDQQAEFIVKKKPLLDRKPVKIKRD